MYRYLSLIFIFSALLGQHTAIKAHGPMAIDGAVEADWQQYLKFDEFIQRWPNLRAPSTVKSEVYFTYDETHIYVAGKFFQPRNTIKGSGYRRDNQEIWNDDWFQFNFDPFNQGAGGFYLGLNPANALIDGKLGPNGQEDESWDGIIITQTMVHDDH